VVWVATACKETDSPSSAIGATMVSVASARLRCLQLASATDTRWQ
jgi:hypothetical protein